MSLAIVQIVASALGVLATWFAGKAIVTWLQAYRTSRQTVEQDEIKRESEKLDQQANDDSDRLKKIEGR